MTEALPPDVRHRNLEHLVVEIVRGVVARNRRLLLVIEDAQWMNLHSMKLLLQVGVGRQKFVLCSHALFSISFRLLMPPLSTVPYRHRVWQLASAKLRVMVVISARPFEEYFETVPNVSKQRA